MPTVLQLLAQPGAFDSLQRLATSSETAFSRARLEDKLQEWGVPDPPRLVDDLVDANLLGRYGTRLGISVDGIRVSLLVDALNGADIHEIYRRLRHLGGQRDAYELVREGMTFIFFKSIVERADFARLYICSPWINPSPRETSYLKYAVMLAQRQPGASPEILVITRPPELTPNGAKTGLTLFSDLDATIFFNRRLHSKLYISEPALRGGAALAIVGSQNLTRSVHLELGIRINGDTQLIDQLIAYFYDVASWSQESE